MKTLLYFKNELAVKRGFKNFVEFEYHTKDTNPVGIENVINEAIEKYVEFKQQLAVEESLEYIMELSFNDATSDLMKFKSEILKRLKL